MNTPIPKDDLARALMNLAVREECDASMVLRGVTIDGSKYDFKVTVEIL